MQVDENDPIMRVATIEVRDASTVVTFDLLDEAQVYVSFDVHVPLSARPDTIGRILRQAHEHLRDRLRRIASEAHQVVQQP